MREADNRNLPFKELDHTADLRVEIWGKDEPELFRNAVESLYVLLGVGGWAGSKNAPAMESLEVQARDLEEALVGLLGEMLYKATVERVRLEVRDLVVRQGGEGAGECSVVVSGTWRMLTDGEMAGQREIKAVTYHDTRIRRTRQGFSARVVMDT